jgi:ribonuclease HII
MKLAPFFNLEGLEAGLDEAGRGCLAGPIFAAAVVLPKDFHHPLLNDSKQLSERNRLVLRDVVETQALAWAVGSADETEIDALNISNAGFLAMHRALEQLHVQPELLLVDGKFYKPHAPVPYHCIIKGDGKYAAIAAASILAKTYRDAFMKNLAAEYPHYDWHINKGYPTIKHRAGIAAKGITPHHRLSFRLLPTEQPNE